METEVEGELLTPEEFSKDSGWQTVAVRRSGAKSAPVEQVGGISTGAKPNDNLAAKGRRDRGRAKAKIIRGGRMPPLPKEDAKIIVRSMGGLNISKVGPIVVAEAIWNAVGIDPAKRDSDTMCPNFQQNIMVVSTPSRENATRYVRVECIAVGGQQYDVNAYEAAPHSTCRGVIRGIAPGDGPAELDRKIVNSKNPLALGAKRMKSTGTMVVDLDGYKVPNYTRTVVRSSSVPYIESKWRCATPVATSGIEQMSTPLQMKPFVKDAASPTPTNKTSATPSAGCAVADISPPPKSATRSTRCRTSSDAGTGSDPDPIEASLRPSLRASDSSRTSPVTLGRAEAPDPGTPLRRVGQQMKRNSTLSWADRVRGSGEAGPSRGPRNRLLEQARDAELRAFRRKMQT
ncbi:hypothetical protein HPB49_015275 [Dermacentor silvarum]|uniref:Uncharacterized protein n=1 Tax=Dermacentor silvarum TaxID=543639 RepID=A0ACB8CLH2_DERSI|nr:hypothetical protein HPB49_015275 [Dermacentor silvarum]